jgi:hypothetical protein
VNKGILTRPQLFVISLVILLLGVGWNIFQKARSSAQSEGSIPTTGAVESLVRDSIGCESRWPFAAHDCRVVIKIRHRPEGAASDSTYFHVDKNYFLPAPDLKHGDPVTGYCQTIVGIRGRCYFEQAEALPQQFKVLSIMGVLFAAVFGLVYLRRR